MFAYEGIVSTNILYIAETTQCSCFLVTTLYVGERIFLYTGRALSQPRVDLGRLRKQRDSLKRCKWGSLRPHDKNFQTTVGPFWSRIDHLSCALQIQYDLRLIYPCWKLSHCSRVSNYKTSEQTYKSSTCSSDFISTVWYPIKIIRRRNLIIAAQKCRQETKRVISCIKIVTPHGSND